jgi:hypothetical protein
MSYTFSSTPVCNHRTEQDLERQLERVTKLLRREREFRYELELRQRIAIGDFEHFTENGALPVGDFESDT